MREKLHNYKRKGEKSDQNSGGIGLVNGNKICGIDLDVTLGLR